MAKSVVELPSCEKVPPVSRPDETEGIEMHRCLLRAGFVLVLAALVMGAATPIMDNPRELSAQPAQASLQR